MCQLSWNLGASISWNPQGLSRPVMGLLYFTHFNWIIKVLTSLLRFITILSSYVFRRLMLAHLQWPESSHWFTYVQQFTFLLYRNCCDYIPFVCGIYTCSPLYVFALHIYNTTTIWTTQQERNVPHTCEQTTAQRSTKMTLVQGVETVITTARSTPQRHRGEGRAQLHSFLISVLDRSEWSTSLLGHFTLLK